MSTLIEHYELEDGNEWAVLADGGSEYETIQTYICVPVGDLNRPAEDLGRTVASLRLAAEATRIKCARLRSLAPGRDSTTLIEIINRNLEGVDQFAKEGSSRFFKVPKQPSTFPNSIRPYPPDDAKSQVLPVMEWQPVIGLEVMLDLKAKIEEELREEYFDLLHLRESRPKRRLPPSKANRLLQVTKACMDANCAG